MQKTERLLLRPVRPEDEADLFRIYGDPATHTFNPAGPMRDRQQAHSELRNWLQGWQDDSFGRWAIARQAQPDHTIGFGGLSLHLHLHLQDERRMNNLGYRFETAAWGQGYATEFARFTVDYGFTVLGLSTIEARVRQHHQASIKVLEKAGLHYVSEIQDVAGAPPSRLYALSQAEWLARH